MLKEQMTLKDFIDGQVENEVKRAYLQDLEKRVRLKQAKMDLGEVVELEQDEAIFLGLDPEAEETTFGEDFIEEVFEDE